MSLILGLFSTSLHTSRQIGYHGPAQHDQFSQWDWEYLITKLKFLGEFKCHHPLLLFRLHLQECLLLCRKVKSPTLWISPYRVATICQRANNVMAGAVSVQKQAPSLVQILVSLLAEHCQKDTGDFPFLSPMLIWHNLLMQVFVCFLTSFLETASMETEVRVEVQRRVPPVVYFTQMSHFPSLAQRSTSVISQGKAPRGSCDKNVPSIS